MTGIIDILCITMGIIDILAVAMGISGDRLQRDHGSRNGNQCRWQ